MVGKKVEPALGNDVGLQHAHRSGSGIARVGKLAQSLLLALFVHALEGRERHNYLATGLKIPGHVHLVQRLLRKREGNGAHGADVTGYILSGRAISTGNATLQGAIAVEQCHRHAIELQLADIIDLLFSCEFVNAPLPAAKILDTIGVVEREHRSGVLDFGKALFGLSSDTLRW